MSRWVLPCADRIPTPARDPLSSPALKLCILKTGALGDVLRTTAILPGLASRTSGLHVTWVTAPAAQDLVRHHPLVDAVELCRPDDPMSVEALGAELASQRFARVLSFDDEEPLCRLATKLAEETRGATLPAGADADEFLDGLLSGAYLAADGSRQYTLDVAPWFDMGLLSRFGKQEADRRKLANERSHPEIYADMLGIEKGEPELPLSSEAIAFAEDFARRTDLHAGGPVIGMNTGSGGRWESKKLSVERTVALMCGLAERRGDDPRFLVLGGPEEAGRNARILTAAESKGLRVLDAGTDNPILAFAALVDRLDLLVTSDSLALHVANARRVPVLAFFAPTSAAEIDLYGRGIAVRSTAPDYCSYAKDADTSTLTVERLLDPALELLGRGRVQRA